MQVRVHDKRLEIRFKPDPGENYWDLALLALCTVNEANWDHTDFLFEGQKSQKYDKVDQIVYIYKQHPSREHLKELIAKLKKCCK